MTTNCLNDRQTEVCVVTCNLPHRNLVPVIVGLPGCLTYRLLLPITVPALFYRNLPGLPAIPIAPALPPDYPHFCHTITPLVIWVLIVWFPRRLVTARVIQKGVGGGRYCRCVTDTVSHYFIVFRPVLPKPFEQITCRTASPHPTPSVPCPTQTCIAQTLLGPCAHHLGIVLEA